MFRELVKISKKKYVLEKGTFEAWVSSIKKTPNT